VKPSQLANLTLSVVYQLNRPRAFSLVVDLITTRPPAGQATSFIRPLLVTLQDFTDFALPIPALEISGAENAAIPVANLADAIVPVDSTVQIESVEFDGVPYGASFSAGSASSNGVWRLLAPTAATISSLSFTPGVNRNEGAFMNIRVVYTYRCMGSYKNGWYPITDPILDLQHGAPQVKCGFWDFPGSHRSSRIYFLSVTISPVAQAPVLTVHDSIGKEDESIPVSIALAYSNPSAYTEVLHVEIDKVPAGATLNRGTVVSTSTVDGSSRYTVSVSDLSQLLFKNALHKDGVVTLSVFGYAVEPINSNTAISTASASITVRAVAQQPTLTVQPAEGDENSVVPLHVTAALEDTDGSESLTVEFANVPAGASLSAGTHLPSSSVWIVSAADLSTLTITLPHGSEDSFTLQVTAIATEASPIAAAPTARSVTLPLVVTVHAIAYAPTLVLAASTVSTLEDVSVVLPISAISNDPDHNDVLTVSITGLPTGASLSNAVKQADGSFLISASALPTSLTPPPFSDTGFDLQIKVIATEPSNGRTAQSALATLHVQITAVANVPSIQSVGTAVGLEDFGVPISAKLVLADTDGSEVPFITVTPPIGWSFVAMNPSDPFTVSDGDLVPPHDFSGTAVVQVSGSSSELRSPSTAAAAPVDVVVTVVGVADPPILNDLCAVSCLELSVCHIAVGARLQDTDGSESLAVRIGGVPIGVTINSASQIADSLWQWTSPANPSPALSVDFALDLSAYGNNISPFTIWVTASSTEADSDDSTSLTRSILVSIEPIPDTAILAVAPIAHPTTVGGLTVPLGVLPLPVDTSGNEQFLPIIAGGVPADITLSPATRLSSNTWLISPQDLPNLMATLPTIRMLSTEELALEAANGGIRIHFAAATKESSPSLVTSGVPSAVCTILIDPSSSLVPLTDLITSDVHVVEGSNNVPVIITTARDAFLFDFMTALHHTDVRHSFVHTFSKNVVNITTTAAGVSFSTGSFDGQFTWTLAPTDLLGLTMNLPPFSDDDFDLAVVIFNTTHSMGRLIHVIVDAVPTAPVLTVAPASTNQNPTANKSIVSVGGDIASLSPDLLPGYGFQAVPIGVSLSISCSLIDRDGSESLDITIDSVPTGGRLSAGGLSLSTPGQYHLLPHELNGLKLFLPASQSTDVTLQVTCRSTEQRGGQSISATTPLIVHVTPTPPTVDRVSHPPIITVPLARVIANEDQSIGLELGVDWAPYLNESPAQISLTINGVPFGASLNAGTVISGGKYVFSTPSQLLQLGALILQPALHSDADFDLHITSTASRAGAVPSVAATALIHVRVLAVAQRPQLTVASVSASVSDSLTLPFTAQLVDTDGSEFLQVLIYGVPPALTLSNAVRSGSAWAVTSVGAPVVVHGSVASFNLQIVARSTESAAPSEAEVPSASSTATISAVFTVSNPSSSPNQNDGGDPTNTNGSDSSSLNSDQLIVLAAVVGLACALLVIGLVVFAARKLRQGVIDVSPTDGSIRSVAVSNLDSPSSSPAQPNRELDPSVSSGKVSEKPLSVE